MGAGLVTTFDVRAVVPERLEGDLLFVELGEFDTDVGDLARRLLVEICTGDFSFRVGRMNDLGTIIVRRQEPVLTRNLCVERVQILIMDFVAHVLRYILRNQMDRIAMLV